MLRKIEIENFRSINNKVEISFTPEDKIVYLSHYVNEDILKGALFFGSNASGKSTILKAIGLLVETINYKNEDVLKNNKCLFSEKENSYIKYYFKLAKSLVDYEISFNNDGEIIVENVFVDNELVFSKDNINLNEMFLNPIENNLMFFNNDLNPSLDKYKILNELHLFINESVLIMNNKTNNEAYPLINNGNAESYLIDYLNKNGVNEINNFFNKYNFRISLSWTNGNNLSFLDIIKFNKSVPFFNESLGMRTLIILLPSFLSLIKTNGMLIIDEFSSAFHNKLEELIIKFLLKSYSKSQLFIVSHSTNLMKNTLLRMDQIYIVDIDENGTKINRISDYEPRISQNIEKMYLAGVFGGVPLYDEFEDL